MKVAVFQAINENWFFVMGDVGEGLAPVNVDDKPVRFGSPGQAHQWIKAWFPEAKLTYKREHHAKPRGGLVREYNTPR